MSPVPDAVSRAPDVVSGTPDVVFGTPDVVFGIADVDGLVAPHRSRFAYQWSAYHASLYALISTNPHET